MKSEDEAKQPQPLGQEGDDLEVEDVWVADMGVKVEGSEEEIIDLRFYQSCAAECIASGLFQIFVTLAWMAPSSVPLSNLGVVRIALTAGAAFFVLLFMFHTVSGGHITPTITVGLLFSKKITINRAAWYGAAQVAGAFLGVAICRGLSPTAFSRIMHAGMAPNHLHDMTLGGALGAEVFGSVFLVLTVLFSKDTARSINYPYLKILGTLAVGMSLAAAYLNLLPLTGASLNPAHSLAVAVLSGVWPSGLWVYFVGPLLGAALASFIYKTLFTTVIIELNPILGT